MKIYLVTKVERFWHWVNAVGIVLLALSGLNIHFAREFDVFGSLSAAITLHNIVGIIVSLDYLLWAGYMISSRRIRFYLPNRDDMPRGLIRQTRYYLWGIFRGEPHPYAESGSRKFNPLQKWTYLGVMVVLMPIQVASGLSLLYFIENWTRFRTSIVWDLGVLHTVTAIFLTAFLIAHIYLGSTGETPVEHFKMMFTGYAEPEASHESEGERR